MEWNGETQQYTCDLQHTDKWLQKKQKAILKGTPVGETLALLSSSAFQSLLFSHLLLHLLERRGSQVYLDKVCHGPTSPHMFMLYMREETGARRRTLLKDLPPHPFVRRRHRSWYRGPTH